MIKRLIKLITSTIKTSNDFSRQQERLTVIIGKQRKQDYVKLKVPKKYADMMEVIALYGIENSFELRRIIHDHSRLKIMPEKKQEAMFEILVNTIKKSIEEKPDNLYVFANAAWIQMLRVYLQPVHKEE